MRVALVLLAAGCSPSAVALPASGPEACASLTFEPIEGLRADVRTAFARNGDFWLFTSPDPDNPTRAYRLGDQGGLSQEPWWLAADVHPLDAQDANGDTILSTGRGIRGEVHTLTLAVPPAVDTQDLVRGVMSRFISSGERGYGVGRSLSSGALWSRDDGGTWRLLLEVGRGGPVTYGDVAVDPIGNVYFAAETLDEEDRNLWVSSAAGVSARRTPEVVTALALWDDTIVAGTSGGRMLALDEVNVAERGGLFLGNSNERCGDSAHTAASVEAIAATEDRLFFIGCQRIIEVLRETACAEPFPDFARLASIRKAVVKGDQILVVGEGGAVRIRIQR